ncbi:MAG: PTS sugar transporter subunit IIA [Eubacteriaceae bacterium]|jgi:PTS system galactitol-specific IIA component|nr:PTS sugar transporter subunit IIA [Eubacteriaceae bacterium]
MEKMKMNKELLFIKKNFTTKEEVINNTCSIAERLGYVNENFKTDIIKREQEFPTGLDTAVPIAMPHVGTNCNTSFMSITTVEKPVNFKYMDGTEGELPVEIIFLFGIVHPEDQMEVLKKLTALFRDENRLNRIINAQTNEEGFETMKEFLGDFVEAS